jgi:hypothetical protein
VRREALCCILDAVGMNSEECLESDGLPRLERVLRDKSMPGKRRLCPDVRSGAPGDSCDTVKAILPESQSPDDANVHPPERRLKPVPRPASAFLSRPPQLPGRGAMPSEGIQGDEWDT